MLAQYLHDIDRFWLSLIITVSNMSGVPFEHLRGMDVFDFFTLLEIAEEKAKK